MPKIILVEDDPVLGRGLSVNLELEGYEVKWVQSIQSARKAFEQSEFDLGIFDLGLPDGSGLDLCSEIKARNPRQAILILTAQTDEDSVVEGFGAGALDYVRKPFGQRELLARIRSALQEPSRRENRLRFGSLSLMPDRRQVFTEDLAIELNRREFDLLRYLIERAESVVSRESLLEALDKEGEIFDRTIDSHMSHLRSKLRNAGATDIQIASVYGVGYRLEKK